MAALGRKLKVLPRAASNSQNSQRDAQKSGNSCPTSSLADLCDQFVASVNVTDNESFSRVLSSLVASWQKDGLAARAGIGLILRKSYEGE